MPIFADKSPAERKKLIAAIALGAIAIFSVGYLLLGSSSPPARKSTNSNTSAAANTSGSRTPVTTVKTAFDLRQDPSVPPAPIDPRFPTPGSAEVGRNIFVFYVPPPTPSPAPKPIPSPSPTPTPPIFLGSLSPQSVYARTGDFDLNVRGDKFVASVQIYINDAQVPTRFVSAQELTAKIPAAMIAGEGQRMVAVRSTDGVLYSNTATLVVQPAPVPNFNYIGILETTRMVSTAILEDKNTKTQISAQRGDVIGGRFRVTSISAREVVATDTSLQIKHSIKFTGSAQVPYTGQPTRPRSDEDEEPEE
jgi:hypothetical protein